MTNNYQQVRSLMGLAKRAGQVVSGEDSVIQAIRQQTVFLVFLASDAGAATSKKVTDKCHFYQVRLSTAFNAEEISTAIGAQRKIIAISQRGFAEKMTSLLNLN